MRLIDGDALIEKCGEWYTEEGCEEGFIGTLKQLLDKQPTIEPKQGEWIEHKERTIVKDNNFIDFFPAEYECSNCGLRQATYFLNSTLPNFCPNCGARMKGANDND